MWVTLLFLLVACDPPVDPQKTEEAVSWLRSYYRHYPIGGGWAVKGISVDGHRLEVHVEVPDRQARAIIQYDSNRQLRILSAACPNEYEDIWKMLDPHQYLYVEASSESLGVFTDSSCRFMNELSR